MESVLLSLAIVACPIGMGVMMWFMMRSNRHSAAPARTADELRAEHARISQELERREPPQPVNGARS